VSKIDAWRKRANDMATGGRAAITKASDRIIDTVRQSAGAATSVVAEGYSVALDLRGNAELSGWLKDHLSHQVSTIAGKAMDAEYLRTHVGGGWHRLYDGGHSLAGSWNAVHEALPDLSALDRVGTWATEYWKDLITTRGMPIVTLDRADEVSEYFKHLDAVNVAQIFGGELIGVSIYCNWNDPAKLVASASSQELSGIVYANVIAPLASLVALGRVIYLLRKSEQDDLRGLIEPALKGLTRGGASVLLITVVPGGFLLHLSCGIVINLAHGFVWDRGRENKEMIFNLLKECIGNLRNARPKLEVSFGYDRLAT
jgi:hypothetical protein